MSEAKHTPGPFRVEEGTSVVWGACNPDDRTTYGMGYPITDCRVTPAGIWAKGPDHEEGVANAHLFAAAPELLRNERKNLQTLEWQRFRMQELGYPTNELDLAIRQTEEVIAKAEGRSP